MAKKTQKKKPTKKAPVKRKAVKKTVKKIQKSTKKKVTKNLVKKAPAKPVKKLKKAIKKKVVTKKTISKPAKKVAAKKVKSLKKPVVKVAAVKFVAHKTGLKIGDMAPQFAGIDQNGNIMNLSDFVGKKVILYFYPKDDTPGCTATACSLRDEYQFLGDKNYQVIGVSADDMKSHAKFADKYELPFPLIADIDLSVIKAYDVWGTKQFMGRIYDGIIRTTFVIDANGLISNVIDSVDTANHAQQILSL